MIADGDERDCRTWKVELIVVLFVGWVENWEKRKCMSIVTRIESRSEGCLPILEEIVFFVLPRFLCETGKTDMRVPFGLGHGGQRSTRDDNVRDGAEITLRQAEFMA